MEKSNVDINGYSKKPVYDAHMHLHVQIPVDESVAVYKKVMQHFNYKKIALNALPSHGFADNYKAFYFKAQLPGVYVNAGLVHYHNSCDTADGYLEQIKKYYAMGCDGIKMLEGKPDVHRALGKRLDDEIFDKFYAYAEENSIPILMHLGDPKEFWDIEKVPQWAKARGFYYDQTFRTLEGLREEVEGILSKFPKLKLIFAHFYFISHDFEYAEEFMNRWQNVCLDLTPGTEMYRNFDADYDKARSFFEKYSDRILYGTDIYNWHQDKDTIEEKYSHAVNLIRSFLERKEDFISPWIGGHALHPFGFDDNILDKIYRSNFTRLFGEKPRNLNFDLIAENAKQCLNNDELSNLDKANMKQIIKYFEHI